MNTRVPLTNHISATHDTGTKNGQWGVNQFSFGNHGMERPNSISTEKAGRNRMLEKKAFTERKWIQLFEYQMVVILCLFNSGGKDFKT